MKKYILSEKELNKLGGETCPPFVTDEQCDGYNEHKTWIDNCKDCWQKWKEDHEVKDDN